MTRDDAIRMQITGLGEAWEMEAPEVIRRCVRMAWREEFARPDVGPARSTGRGIRTIEATGKGWKLVILMGLMMFATGVALLFMGFGIQQPAMIGAGIIVAALSLPVSMFGKLGAWWHHG